MILKLKAFIYQRTGLYLANKEELDYIISKEFWKAFTRIITKKKNDMRPEDVQGLLIGMWQVKHGLYRPWCRTWKDKIRVFILGGI